jgi:ABC-type antimicrobial peptide transport system permease subunit
MKIPIKYNFRNLFVRKGTTLMTIVSIAFVVLVYIGVLALDGGLKAAFSASGDPQNVVVLRDGARSEVESFFDLERQRLLAAMPGVARAADGSPLASGQVLILQILKRDNGSETNVSIRGVEPAAFGIRPQLKIVEGRAFAPGKGEIIVGTTLASRYRDLKLGREVTLGRIRFKVVGVFDAAGGSFNSEVWGAVGDLSNAFNRTNSVSSAILRASSADGAKSLVKQIEADQRLKVKALTEVAYFKEQATANGSLFLYLGRVLAVFLGFGACFAAANTMYAQVSARSHEIGTLRAIGFRRRTILVAFLIEAALLGLLAGGVGALLSLPLNGMTAATMNGATFSEITFSLRTTPSILMGGIFLAVFTGLIGGFPAAVSASRRKITDLLRER